MKPFRLKFILSRNNILIIFFSNEKRNAINDFHHYQFCYSNKYSLFLDKKRSTNRDLRFNIKNNIKYSAELEKPVAVRANDLQKGRKPVVQYFLLLLIISGLVSFLVCFTINLISK